MNQNQPLPTNFNLPEPVSAPAQPQLSVPQPDAQAAPTATQPQPTQQRNAAGDTLDAHWVQAVEQAVHQYIEDPRTLSLRIDELRSQYLSGRFGKDVKRQGGDRIK